MAKVESPIKHPVPTATAVKELSANAYRCAYPGCPRPLYRVDEENGDRTLNSTVAHICARSEGGPRWNKNQTKEDNMSVEDLLVLCLELSSEIDERKKNLQIFCRGIAKVEKTATR